MNKLKEKQEEARLLRKGLRVFKTWKDGKIKEEALFFYENKLEQTKKEIKNLKGGK